MTDRLNHRNPAFPILIFCAFLLLFAGCARYAWVREDGSGPSRIFVGVIQNQAAVPGFEPALNRAIRRAVDSEPSFQLVSSPDRADYLIEGTLVSLQRSPGARQAGDTARALSLQYEITLRLSLIEGRSGRVLMDARPFREEGVFYETFSFAEAERQQIPFIARDLAERVVLEIRSLLQQSPIFPDAHESP